MTKVKEKLYEHRFGLFFFAVLIVYSFFMTNNMHLWEITDLTKSFHAVDFSVGFCTRLLPGAIYSLFFGSVEHTTLVVYVYSILLISFILICFLLNKLVLKTKEELRITTVFLIMFFLTGPSTFSVYRVLFTWLDLYWLLLAAVFFLCLSTKRLYVLIIPVYLAVIMIHYGSIVCFIPMFSLCILYKISVLADRNEKRLLTAVFFICVFSTLLLFGYMLLFENYNLNYTMEEFNDFLLSKGGKDLEYYDYTFYRDSAETTFEEFYGGDLAGKITVIDTSNPIKALFQIIIQNIQTTLKMSTFSSCIGYIICVLPVIMFIILTFFSGIKDKETCKLKKFVFICGSILFFLTVGVGGLFSTDTSRWICHGYMCLLVLFFYIIYAGDFSDRERIQNIFSKIPLFAWMIYFLAYEVTPY